MLLSLVTFCIVEILISTEPGQTSLSKLEKFKLEQKQKIIFKSTIMINLDLGKNYWQWKKFWEQSDSFSFAAVFPEKVSNERNLRQKAKTGKKARKNLKRINIKL
jgi:hypothetical protein